MFKFERTYIKTVLLEQTAVVTFIKKNGDERVMTCTLQASLLPPHVIKEAVEGEETKAPKKENLEVLAVFDLTAKSWRSFRIDSVTKVEKQ